MLHCHRKELPSPFSAWQRLLELGPKELSDRELLDVLLQSPTSSGPPALGAERLLEIFGHLTGLGRAGIHELATTTGLNLERCGRLAVALEAGRRSLRAPGTRARRLQDPRDVWTHYRVELGQLDREVFLVLGLDVHCRLVGKAQVAVGGLARCMVEPREVFLPMLRCAAHSIVLVHNHPSGDPTPSTEDLRLTRRLAEAGAMLGLGIADHIVVTAAAYFSMAESGSLP